MINRRAEGEAVMTQERSIKNPSAGGGGSDDSPEFSRSASSKKKEDAHGGVEENDGLMAEEVVFNILLIEDSDTDAMLIRRILSRSISYPNAVTHVHSMKAGLAELRKEGHGVDIVLLDLGLPDTVGGAGTFEELKDLADEIPIVVLTGLDSHKAATDLIKEGAQDFVNKDELSKSPQHLRDVIDFAVERHRKHRDALNKSQSDMKNKDELLNGLLGGYSFKS